MKLTEAEKKGIEGREKYRGKMDDQQKEKYVKNYRSEFKIMKEIEEQLKIDAAPLKKLADELMAKYDGKIAYFNYAPELILSKDGDYVCNTITFKFGKGDVWGLTVE